jgi:hypothetical protein
MQRTHIITYKHLASKKRIADLQAPENEWPPIEPQTHSLDPFHDRGCRPSLGIPNARKTVLAFLPPGMRKNLTNGHVSNASLVASFSFSVCNVFLYLGRSATASRVTLTYTATLLVALAVHQAGRPDLICSLKCVLAHCWEDWMVRKHLLSYLNLNWISTTKTYRCILFLNILFLHEIENNHHLFCP